MKKKSLATLLSGFLTVALTGVGFASWIITGGDTKEIQGTVSAETVENRKTTITLLQDDAEYDASVCFGHNPNKKGTTTPVTETWFKVGPDEMKEEDLSAKIVVEIENATYSTFSVTIDSKFDTYKTQGYIDYTIEFTAPSTNTATKTFVDITFEWGSKFGGLNPYEYFNSIEKPEQSHIDTAMAINTVFADLNSGINVKIVATYNEA